ncbi:MAG: YbhB/YbcL family Raf kinase inhibitor-like protein [Burkholderiales bacterium]|nr:YbhB/YbcL family Raf kinase inhibitor-like protein [Burkholderiales bacterium]
MAEAWGQALDKQANDIETKSAAMNAGGDKPADVTELPGNAGTPDSSTLPKGATQSRIDYGVKAWGGVCPPQGDKPHRYIFTVHALKIDKLDVPADATAALTGFMINANSLAKASFTAKYGRKKPK